MAVQIPFPIPNHGYALNSKMRINLDYIVQQFNQFNTGSATWDTVAIGIGNSETGVLQLLNASNANYLNIQAGATASNITYTLPAAIPTATYNFMLAKADGTMKWSSISFPDTYTGNELLYISGLGVLTELPAGSSNQILRTVNPPKWVSLLGTTHQVIVTNNTNDYTLSLPQSIDTTSNVQFNQVITDGGTVTNPGVAVIFSGASTNTGLFSSDGTSLSVTVAGALRGAWDNTGDYSAVTSLSAPTVKASTAITLKTSTSHQLTMQMTVSGGSDYTINWPNAQGGSSTVLTNDGSGNLTWTTPSGTGANVALSNLSSVAINTALLPGTDNSIALGSASKQWTSIYLSTSEINTATSNQFVLGTTRTVTITAPTPASSSRIVTIPDLSTDYSVVGDAGTQTIGGSKTFSSGVTISASSTTALNISTNNAFVVDSTNVKIGIGTASPSSSYKLDIQRNTAGDIGQMRLSGDNGSSDGGAGITLAYNNNTKWSIFTRNVANHVFSLGFSTAEDSHSSDVLELFTDSVNTYQKYVGTLGTSDATIYTPLNLFAGGNSSNCYFQQCTTTGISGATRIAVVPGQAQLVLVSGSNGSGARFSDLLFTSSSSSTVTVITSMTDAGSPSTRTYSRSGNELQLAMSSGTYTTNVLTLNASARS